MEYPDGTSIEDVADAAGYVSDPDIIDTDEIDRLKLDVFGEDFDPTRSDVAQFVNEVSRMTLGIMQNA